MTADAIDAYDLLARAAELKAGGASWDGVARKLRTTEDELRALISSRRT